MDFEKSNAASEHTITSGNLLVDKDTDRVVAVFYSSNDLDHVIGAGDRALAIDECISAIQSCELVEPGIRRIRLYEAIGALVELKRNQTHSAC